MVGLMAAVNYGSFWAQIATRDLQVQHIALWRK
jgi:hypothetical protein